MLTISRLRRWSIDYYNRTADEARQAGMDHRAAGGGLGEYYSEGDTRAPIWLVAGDRQRVADLTGLSAGAVQGGCADTGVAARWLDDGVAPNGAAGRAFREDGVHGFDLTFAAPKSVSLVRALGNEVAEKTIANAHVTAVEAAMAYLHEHAGYTRVYNTHTKVNDLERLPGLVTIAYQHETSRCGDPHLHTHVIVPNRQARGDGKLVSLDSKSLFHEAKAAGVVYQAVLRHELHAQLGVEWEPVDGNSGMAEIAGVSRESITAWSRRSTRLREWAAGNLTIVEGRLSAAQLAAAQKATRPVKPEGLSWAHLKHMWRADARGLIVERAAHQQSQRARESAPRLLLDRDRLARMVAGIDKAAFSRADLVELVGALLPVDVPGDPRALIERVVDMVAVRVSAPRERHHREGHERYTVDAVLVEEERVFAIVDELDTHTRLDVRAQDVADLSPDQAHAVAAIAGSPYLVQPLQAPAGAGKTHSLTALRAAAHRSGKDVLVLAPTGKAVDEAMREQAGDRGLTVAKALQLIAEDHLAVDRRTVIVVDEASMVATPDLQTLLACAVTGRAKIVLVGDAYQLSPVKARGGMFEHLCADLPWSQRLSEVWRMRTPAEREASLVLRSGHGSRLRKAVGWYRNQGRLHTGDPIAMADDATAAYVQARRDGKDAAIICDKWEIADAINRRLHDTFTDATTPAVRVAREQHVRTGDIIISRRNDAAIVVGPGLQQRRGDRVDQVRNGNRWTVAGVDAATGRIVAERLTDSARVVFDGDYLREHITLGYATTVHAAQGITVGSATRQGACFTVLSDNASRAMAYVGMTRGKDENHVLIYQPITGESDHEHLTPTTGESLHVLRRGTKYAAAQYFRTILANDDRPHTMHAEAERTQRELLPDAVRHLLDRNDQRRTARAGVWRAHTAEVRAREAAYERITATIRDGAERRAAERCRGLDGDSLEL